jgi:hypothetical protein
LSKFWLDSQKFYHSVEMNCNSTTPTKRISGWTARISLSWSYQITIHLNWMIEFLAVQPEILSVGVVELQFVSVRW